MGYEPTPHQLAIWDIALEHVDGVLCYSTVILIMPRQQAKTSTVLPVELDRCLNWLPDGREKVLYATQDQERAGKILLYEQLPVIEDSESVWKHIAAGKAGVVKRAGAHALVFKNGSTIRTVSSNRHGARGITRVGLAVCDELYSATDTDLDEAIRPTMLHRTDSQVWYLSSAGDETSVLLLQKQDAGKAAVEADTGHGICFFEWSAPEDAPIADPATWRACMPMLQYGILSEDKIRAEYDSLSENVFRKEYLCQWVNSEDRVIPADVWEDINSTTAEPKGQRFLAVDISPLGKSASIAGSDTHGVIELLTNAAGTAWVRAEVERLAKAHRAVVAIDTYGPGGHIAKELEDAGVEIVAIQGNEMAKACAYFYESCINRSIQIRSNYVLDEAAAMAKKRDIGDAWAWTRKASHVDISPLVAVTLARWLARDGRPSTWSMY